MIKTKAKCIKCCFSNGDFRIFNWSPVYKSDDLKLSSYFTFSTKGNDSYIDEGKEYELELEEISVDSRYGGTYKIISCPSLTKLDLQSLSKTEKMEILMDCTSSQKIANNILEAYPDFIEKVLTEGKDSIDTKLIHGVGESYLNSYVRTLNEKYKYYSILQHFKEYKLDITDCKTLVEILQSEDNIEQSLKENPYKVNIEYLNRSFENADKLIMELRPDLKESEQRCAYLILSVLQRNEQDGSTRLNGNDLYYYILNEYNVPELEPLIVDVAKNNDLFYFDEESKDLSIATTYAGECLIADFAKERIKNSKKLDIDWTKYTEIDGFTMSKKQQEALELFCKYNFMILAGYSGSGKAQPIDTVIPTPNGNKKLGDIKVGDYVFDRLGNPTKVLGVYPQGIKDCYTVTLADGRQTKCNDEHLWSYYTSRGNLATKTLREMIDSGIYYNECGNVKHNAKYNIPTNGAVEYKEKEYDVDPYVIGSLLGNGCCKENILTISSNDEEQIKEVARLLNSVYKKNSDKNYSWTFRFKNGNPIHTKELLKKYKDDMCCYSYEKKIPNEYKYGSIEQRINLLQGLFDTDGCIRNNAPRFSTTYSTSSLQLAKDVQEILFSLGYSCSIHCDNRSKKTNYQISVLIDNSEKQKLFRLKRKLEIAKNANEYKKHRNYDRIKIVNVEKEENPCEMVCIYVDNEEHLYLTNDYIVTHNTSSLKGIIKLMEDNGLTYTLLSPTGKASMRITESVHREASTIHRKCLKDVQISTDVVIVDETSMVDLPTFVMMLKCITNENVRVVLVGDNAQLMPVGIGCVFNDLINSGKIPMVMLDEIFRYDTNGGLFVATNVRQGKAFFDDEKMVKKNGDTYSICDNYKFIETEGIFDRLVEEYMKLIKKGVKPNDILCLSPFNVGEEGSYKINNAIQSEINPPKANDCYLSRKVNTNTNIAFRVGDRILNKKNDYQALPLESYKAIEDSHGVLTEEDVLLTSVFNGQDGTIRELDDKKMVVQFDEELVVFNKSKLNNLLLAYCISVHSSQGSEAKYVLNVVSPNHKKMLNRNLLYVADTRAKTLQIDIGSRETYENALLIDGNAERSTWLKELL